MKRQQLALNTVSLRGDFEAIVQATAAAGFRYIEFPLSQPKEYLTTHTVEELQLLLRSLGLQCVGGFESGLGAGGTAEQQAANVAGIVANGTLLSQLGEGFPQALVVGTEAPPFHEMENPIGQFAASVARAAGELAPLGVNLLVEFNWGPVKTLAMAAEIARQSGAANAGVLFDPAHYHCTPTKLEQLDAANVATVKHVHVNNMRPIPAELSNCNSDRLLPDDPAGVLDLRQLFGALEAHGYSGLYSIEMFSDELWALPPAEAARRMYQSLLPLCEG